MILITGASGKIGRDLIQFLLAAGSEVIAVTRDPKATQLPEEVRILTADSSKPGSLAGALEGVEAVFLNPAAIESTAREVLTLARRAGVRRVVLISAITVEYGGGYRRFAERFRALEQIVEASGLAWTFLRAADFAANSLIWAAQVRSSGKVRGAYGKAATAPIHHRDIAGVAARALLDEKHAGHAYAITGPQTLTQSDRTRIIGEAIGQAVEFEEISPDQARAAMLRQGVPPEVPDRMLGYLAACLAEPGPVTSTVENVLGQPAIGFAQWASENRSAFMA